MPEILPLAATSVAAGFPVFALGWLMLSRNI